MRTRRSPRTAALLAVVLLATALAGPVRVSAQDGTTTTSVRSGRTSTGRPGRVAYVTLTGDVVVAGSDGSAAKVVGTDAAKNAIGLSPLAWSPVGDRVAYVRSDRALVLASADASDPPLIVANDAVLPPGNDEDAVSFIVTGTAVAYLAEEAPGRLVATVRVFDGPPEQTEKPFKLTDPASRVPLGFQFSPLDPYLYLRSADTETGKEFTIAISDPFTQTPFATPFSVDDPAFAPDGAFLYGVVRGSGLDQLVRVDTGTGRFTSLRDQDRICKPQPSPDGRRLVYAAGPGCNQVWVIDDNGANPSLVVENVGGSASFAEGNFSWSLDGSVVSHPACKQAGGAAVTCGGAYWDIDIAAKAVKARAQAGSVAREMRPLVKPLKVSIEIAGPERYDGQMLISAKANGALLQRPRQAIVEARTSDEQDPSRTFSVKLLSVSDQAFVVGTVRVTDPKADFDQQFLVMARVFVQSYRFATLRGVWMKTGNMPLEAGRVDISIFR